jgi:hypothetical protein
METNYTILALAWRVRIIVRAPVTGSFAEGGHFKINNPLLKEPG